MEISFGIARRRFGKAIVHLAIVSAVTLACIAVPITSAWADDVTTVSIPDATFQAVVRHALDKPSGDITRADMARLKQLSVWQGVESLEGLQYAVNLEQLQVCEQPSLSDISPVAELHNLRHLELCFDQQLTNISPIAGLTSLRTLQIQVTPVSDVSPLASLSGVQNLYLGENRIADVSPLAGLQNLTNLCIDGNQITDISPLANLGSLEQLALGSNRITDLSPLVGLRNLSALYLKNYREDELNLPADHVLNKNRITDISPLASLVNLHYLDLDNNQVSDISPIAGLENLSTIRLADNEVTLLPDMGRLDALQTLILDGNQLTDIAPMSSLGRDPNGISLYRISLRDNLIADISPLAGLQMGELDLAGNRIADISPLAGLVGLQSLNLDDNDVTDVTSLAGMQSMSLLYLKNNHISDISSLAGKVWLSTLDLDNNEVSDLLPLAGAAYLSVLDLDNNRVSDITPLTGTPGLSVLHLRGNRVSDLAPVAGMWGLGDLDVGGNQVTDISPLAGSVNLNSLCLDDNQITDISALVPVVESGALNYRIDVQQNFLDVAPGSVTRTFLDAQIARGVPVTFEPQKQLGANQAYVPAGTGTTAVVGNVSVAFSSVARAGLLTAQASATPSAPPSGYSLAGQGAGYEISTTAAHSGLVTVAIGYSDEGMTLASEAGMKLFHFQDGAWQDITTSVDTDRNVVNGECESFSPFAVCVPVPVVSASPVGVNFGDVELGQSTTAIVTVTNAGACSTSLAWSLESTAGVSMVNPPASWPAIAPGASVDVTLRFAPGTTGFTSAALRVVTQDPAHPEILVSISGNGVRTELPPEQEIRAILAYFDTSVSAHTLYGIGPGKSAVGRQGALRNMIEAAGDLVGHTKYDKAAQQLRDVYAKCDGRTLPPDFVDGSARPTLAAKIAALATRLDGTP